jgi:hypothetical protein
MQPGTFGHSFPPSYLSFCNHDFLPTGQIFSSENLENNEPAAFLRWLDRKEMRRNQVRKKNISNRVLSSRKQGNEIPFATFWFNVRVFELCSEIHMFVTKLHQYFPTKYLLSFLWV